MTLDSHLIYWHIEKVNSLESGESRGKMLGDCAFSALYLATGTNYERAGDLNYYYTYYF